MNNLSIIVLIFMFILFFYRNHESFHGEHQLTLQQQMKKNNFIRKESLLSADNSIIIYPFDYRPDGYQISYRLGDVLKNLYDNVDKYHLQQYPNSIAASYLKRVNMVKPPNVSNLKYLDKKIKLQIIEKIIEDMLKKKKSDFLLPTPKDLVVHVRIGDVLEGVSCNFDTILKEGCLYGNNINYIKPLSYYENICKYLKNKNISVDNLYIVAGTHFNISLDVSCRYLNAIKNIFEKNNFITQLRINNHPDDDFVFMTKAKYFVTSGGAFSRYIGEFVRRNNGTVISDFISN